MTQFPAILAFKDMVSDEDFQSIRDGVRDAIDTGRPIMLRGVGKGVEYFPPVNTTESGNVIIKCLHCGQFAATKTICPNCGAAIE